MPLFFAAPTLGGCVALTKPLRWHCIYQAICNNTSVQQGFTGFDHDTTHLFYWWMFKNGKIIMVAGMRFRGL